MSGTVASGVEDWATAWTKTESGHVYHKYEIVDSPRVVRRILGYRRDPLRRSTALVSSFIADLMRYRERGWDGDDADPVSSATAITAISIIAEMLVYASSWPHVAPIADGSLSLLWTFDDSTIEIIIEPGEAFPSYAMRSPRVGVLEEVTLESSGTLRDLLLAQQPAVPHFHFS